jgi:bifunctional non-homologous end joining protein LigD
MFKSFPALCDGLTRDLKGRHCVLDDEIVCLDATGKPQFRDLLFRRAEPLFYTFDILWDEHALGRRRGDTQIPKRRRPSLSAVDRPQTSSLGNGAKRGERLLYCDHIDSFGEALFRLACEHDLEGIVAKRKSDPYLPDHATWLKIHNQNYSQWVGRERAVRAGARKRSRFSSVGCLRFGV